MADEATAEAEAETHAQLKHKKKTRIGSVSVFWGHRQARVEEKVKHR
jgi:hypothetical protein